MTNEIEQLTMEKGYLDAEMEMLFKLAKVKDEEEFQAKRCIVRKENHVTKTTMI